MDVQVVNGVTMLVLPREGTRIGSERDATDVIGHAFEHTAAIVAIPVERFDDMFFHLSTRIAGDVIQKFVNYRIQLAVIGDISSHVSTSTALRDFVYESNRGSHVWFLGSQDELVSRLEAR